MRIFQLTFGSLVVAGSAGLMLIPNSPAEALDCAKSKTPVEVTICSDNTLKKEDASLSETYFATLREAKESGFIDPRTKKNLHDALLEDQRVWLARREKQCGDGTHDQIKLCVEDALKTRRESLINDWQGTEGEVSEEAGLKIGTEILTVGSGDDGQIALKHNGHEVISAASYLTTHFTIDQRWESPEVNAALVEAGVVATLNCVTAYVLETRAKGNLITHELGELCVAFEMNFLIRTKRGFALTVPPNPTEGGEIREWDAKTGTVTKRKIPFRPNPGTMMHDLLISKRAGSAEPLRNEEFFDAVEKVPADDRGRLLNALWNVTKGCACSGPAQQERYGPYLDQDLIAYSGCGWYMYGAQVRCTNDEGLAIWVKKSDSFFFVVGPLEDGERDPESTDRHFYPPLEAWPASARNKYQDWLRGSKWSNANK